MAGLGTQTKGHSVKSQTGAPETVRTSYRENAEPLLGRIITKCGFCPRGDLEIISVGLSGNSRGELQCPGKYRNSKDVIKTKHSAKSVGRTWIWKLGRHSSKTDCPNCKVSAIQEFIQFCKPCIPNF